MTFLHIMNPQLLNTTTKSGDFLINYLIFILFSFNSFQYSIWYNSDIHLLMIIKNARFYSRRNMDLVVRHQYIASLVAKEHLGLLDQAKKKELDIWVKENSRHRLLYERLKLKNYTKDMDSLYLIING